MFVEIIDCQLLVTWCKTIENPTLWYLYSL